VINNSNITIAGQTAPSPGITIKRADGYNFNDSEFRVEASEVIIRHLRLRPGPDSLPLGSAYVNALFIGSRYRPVRNVILDHMSISWGVDETTNYSGDTQNVTIQNSIIAEGLLCSNHELTVNPARFNPGSPQPSCPTGGQSESMGMLISASTINGVPTSPSRLSLYRNLFAHNYSRNPVIGADGIYEIINSVIYNHGQAPLTVHTYPSQINYIGNYHKPGQNTDLRAGWGGSAINVWADVTKIIYESGNVVVPPMVNVTQPSQAYHYTTVKNPTGVINVLNASSAYSQVLNSAGATLPGRDSIDSRIVNDVVNGTGVFKNSPSEGGGWPTGSGSHPASYDTDHDGMPDAWEGTYGLNPTNASDGNGDPDQDSYTNVEEFLNGTAPTIASLPPPPSTPDPTIPPAPTPTLPPSDTTPPAITILFPQAGALATGTVEIVTEVRDDKSGIQSVTFKVDTTTILVDTSINYRVPLATTNYTDGIHTISITAVDKEGNYNTQSIAIDIRNKGGALAPSPTPLPETPTAPPSETSDMKVGAIITVTVENLLRVRETAGGSILGYQASGKEGTITEGPVVQGGYTWWRVTFTSGTSGWTAGNYLKTKSQTQTKYSFTRTLKMGSRGEDVKKLQVLLNTRPETRVSDTGPGSPGQESTYFGAKTKAAVIKFQEAYRNEILVPNNITKGTGVVGERTRKTLEKI